MGLYAFGKLQRLSKRNWIQELFEKGSSFYSYPFKVLHIPLPDQATPAHQMLVSVSSRNIKKAVTRNLIKRRVREAYRLQQHALVPPQKIGFALIYTPKEPLEFEEIKKKVEKVLRRLTADNPPQ
ncbi:MAG: ribonuclease P protein component [Bacteroidia bacterium]|nr:ribonuclease P protein component [Bacteroidia bacterium]